MGLLSEDLADDFLQKKKEIQLLRLVVTAESDPVFAIYLSHYTYLQ